jgi:predicted  nucleic acid-binding Zn-ribbon protein
MSDFLTSRDMWAIQRELGIAQARDEALAKELAEIRTSLSRLSTEIGAHESRMIAQMGSLRAELITETDRAGHKMHLELRDLSAKVDDQGRQSSRLLLIVAAIAGAALGLEGLSKLGLL